MATCAGYDTCPQGSACSVVMCSPGRWVAGMDRPEHNTSAGQEGFTIVEAMVACVLLLIGLVATLTIVERAASVTSTTRTREQATSLQRELVEGARSVAYDQLTPTGVGAAVRARPGLGDSALGGAGWTVRRRNATYTVAIGVCTVDDPADGIGAHQSGIFCASAGGTPEDANADGTVDALTVTGATACAAPCPDTNPADFKRVVSVVRWGTTTNVQATQISNPGVAAAPAITGLTPIGLPSPYTITDGRATQDVNMTWLGTPRTVTLYVDGTPIGTITVPVGTSWTSAWNLGLVSAAGQQPAVGEVLDGSYELSAKAFDQYAQYGAQRAETVVLNRRQAFASAHVEAGRNNGAVEIEWSPARERDSKGFRVDRRIDGGAWTTVCAMAVRTSCRDTSAPAAAVGQLLEYSVVGFDLDPAGALRPGDRSEIVKIIEVPGALTPVPVPTGLSAALDGANVSLTWAAPSGFVPDHYNVYRDGTGYADRLDSVYQRPADITAGVPPSYVDATTTGQLHDYWVTVVDANLRESAPVGPVRR